MPSVSRTNRDWLIVVVVNLTVPAMVAWKHHTGEASRTVALISGFASLLVINAVILAAIHYRGQRSGKVLQRGFVIGAIGLALASALLTATGIYFTPERNDYLELALSNIPLGQIHPEQKALVVDLLRRSAANSRDYEMRPPRRSQSRPSFIPPSHLPTIASFAQFQSSSKRRPLLILPTAKSRCEL